MGMRQILQAIIETDRSIHDSFTKKFPKTVRIIDVVLSAFLNIVSNPVFAIILALVLVPLVTSERISLVNAISIAAAWVVAVAWLTRSAPLKDLPVPSRFLLMICLAMLLAIGGIKLGHWSTHEWEAHHKEPPPNKAEDLSNKTEPKTVAPETKPIEPYVPKVRLIFKDSPLLTPPRREHINKTIDALYVYLTGLGFTMEREFPPIGVSSDNVFKGGGTYPGTIYDKGFLLPKNRIEDETLIRWMYAREIFTVLLCAPQESTIFRLEAEPIFTGYYVSSFKGDVHSLAKNTWINKLWAVRQAKGKDIYCGFREF
jgi:hypothetical protein